MTNTAAVGGAGVGLAYKLLSGETVTPSAGAGRPNTILLDPQILDNTTRSGQDRPPGMDLGPGHGPAVATGPVDPRLHDVRPDDGPVVLLRAHSQPFSSSQGGGRRLDRLPAGLFLYAREPMTIDATDLLLEATDVSKTYGAVVALQRRSLARPTRAKSMR